MSVMSWAVYRLNIDYCNELKITKMSPYGTWALVELDYAIYDGLEMILKVTKNATKSLCRHSMVQMMMMGESVIVSSVVCLLLFWCKSTLFSSGWSWKKSKMVHGGLTTVIRMWWSWKQPILFVYTMVLKWVNFDAKFTVSVSNGLERSHLWVLIFSWALTLACCCIL